MSVEVRYMIINHALARYSSKNNPVSYEKLQQPHSFQVDSGLSRLSWPLWPFCLLRNSVT